MIFTPETLNLYQKLAKLRKMTEVVQKNRRGFNYKYTSVDEILARVTAGMAKYAISLVPKFHPGSESISPYHYEKTKVDKSGAPYVEHNNEIIVHSSMSYVWVNDENPEEIIEVPWLIVGSQQDPAQALGSGLTYGLRQFLTQYFQIATLDDTDSDAWRTKQREAAEEEDRVVAESIIEEVHTAITEHVAKYPDDRDKFVMQTKLYTKKAGRESNNYKTIKDPAIAAELLEAVKAIVAEHKED